MVFFKFDVSIDDIIDVSKILRIPTEDREISMFQKNFFKGNRSVISHKNLTLTQVAKNHLAFATASLCH
jgi:hypothetical protein